MVTAVVAATPTARASGLRAARSRGVTAGRTASATIFAFFLDDRFGLRSGGRLSSSASFFLGLNTRLLDRGLFGLAVVFGTALFVFALLGALAIIATAGFLERCQARFLGLA